jgi:predicted AlkP superfamily pyrophosphatase or phosphodiesterase
MRIRSVVTGVLAALALAGSAWAGPKVVVISLDGAKPDFIEHYLDTGVLDRGSGLGRLARHGVRAERNVTANPSLTAPGHILIATGSTSAHDNIASNTFHPVAGASGSSFSGFAAPIGGYEINPLGPTPESELTALPLWVNARRAGKVVVTATWAGGDGADIALTLPGAPSVVIQPAVPYRTVDYTVPFGAFGGVGAQGYAKAAADFAPADASLVGQLAAAGFTSASPVKVTSLETVFCAPTSAGTCGTTSSSVRTLRYVLVAAALDTTADGRTNYDTLVVFSVPGPTTAGITDAPSVLHPGPFARPSTGPAVVRLGHESAPFFFEGSGSVVGASFFATTFASDLSTVHLIRYGASFIPRNAAALDAVNDINDNVGFWRPQPDFRIPQRLIPGFDAFPDIELEAAWEDLVSTWIRYQGDVAIHALRANPDADLAMIYFEQPDGSEHQFLLTDWRQPTNPRDPTSIGSPGWPAGATGQDPAKVARYRKYVQNAYQAADSAVERVIQATGIDRHGAPESNVIVVSDHGFAPFHTAVNVTELLRRAGVDTSKIIVRTSGPAANVYVNLAGREAGGTVSADDYGALVEQIAGALRQAVDPNAIYNGQKNPTFTQVVARPGKCKKPGFCTSEVIGQDYGDVFATMAEGYNFDGIQTPVVARLGDPAIPAGTIPVYSLPNFYGAHGHDPQLPEMSATFIAAGPDFRRGVEIGKVRNIDVAPTVLEILDVEPASTVDGRVLRKALEQPRHCDWQHWWRCWDDDRDDDHH